MHHVLLAQARNPSVFDELLQWCMIAKLIRLTEKFLWDRTPE
jgi:hypothetical protein